MLIFIIFTNFILVNKIFLKWENIIGAKEARCCIAFYPYSVITVIYKYVNYPKEEGVDTRCDFQEDVLLSVAL